MQKTMKADVPSREIVEPLIKDVLGQEAKEGEHATILAEVMRVKEGLSVVPINLAGIEPPYLLRLESDEG